MLRRRSLAVICATAVLGVAASQEASAQNTVCSLERVEVDPASVIEPCSVVIGTKGLSDADKGYALWIRGKAYHATKRFDLAAIDYDQAMTLTPNNEETFVSRANIAFRGKRWNEAWALLQKALKINPRSASALRAVGSHYHTIGDYDQAVSFYSQALVTDRFEPYALLMRSEIFSERGQFDLAMKDADSLVAIPPDQINRRGYFSGAAGDRLDFHIVALKHRADIQRQLNRADLAEQDLTRAVDYKRNAESLVARGNFLFYYLKGRDADALRDLSEASALTPDDDDIHFTLGNLQMRLKAWPQAMGEFNAALKISSHYWAAMMARARVHREFGQTDLAVKDMEKALVVSRGTALARMLPALRQAGYWQSKDDPIAYTPALADAIRACMIDKEC